MQIAKLEGEFFVLPDAVQYYEKWHDEFKGDFTGRLAGYFERKPDHVLKLAMLLSVNYSNDMIITIAHIKEAIKMLEELEALMPKAFAYIGATNEAIIAQKITEIISTTTIPLTR